MPAADTRAAPVRRRIAILPSAVADQIAAGEVVERPASVVKELVENALDAGARHVRVEIEQGGKTAIIVADDGWGMNRDDAILALDRHATSKVATAADLVGIATFGFRGEALPAIASVSRFTLSTADAPGEGSEIAVAGGRIEGVTPVSRQRGTTVTVRGLFFNTPARRKFLRSVASEVRACHDAIVTLALAHPSVGFEFHADSTSRVQVPTGQNEAERLRAVWGGELADSLLPLSHAAGGFRIQGFVQRPADARPTGRRTQLFVNGRPFRDAFLVRAAEAGYRSTIHPGDRPSLLLNIQVNPSDVDVNVHPAKLEVRFRDRIGLERTVEDAVRHALGLLDAATSVGGVRSAVPWTPAEFPVATEVADLFAPLGDATTAHGDPASTDPQGAFAAPLFALFDTYIAFEAEDAMIIVDQHSAHERVLYEEVMRELTGAGATAQRLLMPATVELTDEELDAVQAHNEVLSRVGYEAETFGGRTVVLHAVPALHARFDAVACFRELVADLARGRFGGWSNRLERFAATFACRAAVKAGDRLSEREMRELLVRLFASTLPPHDVHGRATIVQLPREELERRFGRR